jgi:hypothetical protein
MLIRYNIQHAFYPGSDKTLNALTLQILVDTLVRLNVAYLRECKYHSHPVPLLYESGVVYDRTVVWEPIPALYTRRHGDCKSLTGAWIAQAYMRGISANPVFRFVDNADGSTDYHILVALSNGTFEDPSKVLGMGQDEVAKYYGAGSYGMESIARRRRG